MNKRFDILSARLLLSAVTAVLLCWWLLIWSIPCAGSGVIR